jgi:hypothetical protein
MEKKIVKIKVRKEVTLCLKCKREKVFFYLSDYSYGQRLIKFCKGTKYAYVNLIEDSTYDELEKLLCNIMKDQNYMYTMEEMSVLLNDFFGLTCDSIEGELVDTRNSLLSDSCEFCGSDKFESNLIEPVQFIEMDLPIVTHNNWNILYPSKKKETIEKWIKDMKSSQNI